MLTEKPTPIIIFPLLNIRSIRDDRYMIAYSYTNISTQIPSHIAVSSNMHHSLPLEHWCRRHIGHIMELQEEQIKTNREMTTYTNRLYISKFFFLCNNHLNYCAKISPAFSNSICISFCSFTASSRALSAKSFPSDA